MNRLEAGTPPLHVAHIITRLIVGGAQENTLHNVEDQFEIHGDQVELIIGAETGPEGSLLDRAHQGGFPVHVIPAMQRRLTPLNDWRAYRQLCRLLSRLQPEIVHTHSSKAGILGRAAAAKLGIPVVHTIHGAAFHYGQSPLRYRLYVAAEKWAARRTDRFISVADAMTDAYVQEGVASPDQFQTIHSGFDVTPFLECHHHRKSVRSELGLSESDIVVGKVARLFHLKGHEFVLKAAPRIVAACPQVRFLFVGDGLLRQEIEEEIARQGLERHFIFTGLVPPARIPALMSAMDMVVHTSQWEGLARVLPQGFVAGKPVVSYDVGGAREVVIPNETGFLLPRDSVAELADAVIKLAGDADLRASYGAAGRERCVDLFRHERMTERIRDVYRHVLANRPTS